MLFKSKNHESLVLIVIDCEIPIVVKLTETDICKKFVKKEINDNQKNNKSK